MHRKKMMHCSKLAASHYE